MSTTTIPHGTDSQTEQRVKRGAFTLVRVLLALQFAVGGVMKLTAAETMVRMFDDIGVGQWLRIFVGGIEVVAAVGLLAPVAVGVAALVLSGLMLGALITRVAVLDGPPALELLFLVLAGFLAVHHRHNTVNPLQRFDGRAGSRQHTAHRVPRSK